MCGVDGGFAKRCNFEGESSFESAWDRDIRVEYGIAKSGGRGGV
jgi:hypothetical protein